MCIYVRSSSFELASIENSFAMAFGDAEQAFGASERVGRGAFLQLCDDPSFSLEGDLAAMLSDPKRTPRRRRRRTATPRSGSKQKAARHQMVPPAQKPARPSVSAPLSAADLLKIAQTANQDLPRHTKACMRAAGAKLAKDKPNKKDSDARPKTARAKGPHTPKKRNPPRKAAPQAAKVPKSMIPLPRAEEKDDSEVEVLEEPGVDRGIEGAIVLAPPPLDATVGDVDVSDFPSFNLDIDRSHPKWKNNLHTRVYKRDRSYLIVKGLGEYKASKLAWALWITSNVQIGV